MRIAVASRDGKTISGHIGKCSKWIVFELSESASAMDEPTITATEQVTLPKDLIFHYYRDEQPHPFQDCIAVIGKSSGESFVRKMKKRGIDAVMTAETDPAKAALDFARQAVVPPKPRPIGELICRIHDSFSRHE